MSRRTSFNRLVETSPALACSTSFPIEEVSRSEAEVTSDIVRLVRSCALRRKLMSRSLFAIFEVFQSFVEDTFSSGNIDDRRMDQCCLYRQYTSHPSPYHSCLSRQFCERIMVRMIVPVFV